VITLDEDLKISSAPNALALFNPALDLSGLQSDLGLGEHSLGYLKGKPTLK